MKIGYQLTKQDYIDFNMHYINNSDTFRKSLMVQRYIIPIIFLLIPFVMIKVTSIPLWYWFTVFVICDILWVIFYPRYLKRIISKRVLKMLDEGKNADMLGKRSLTLTEEGIVDSSKLSESKTNWSVIEKVTETEKHIFIFISSVAAYIIPVRVFKVENKKNEFINKLNYMVDKGKVNNNIE